MARNTQTCFKCAQPLLVAVGDLCMGCTRRLNAEAIKTAHALSASERRSLRSVLIAAGLRELAALYTDPIPFVPEEEKV